MADEWNGPLLTVTQSDQLQRAREQRATTLVCSLDLNRSVTQVATDAGDWSWQGRRYPYPQQLKERTIYYWSGTAFAPVARFVSALVKLVPTQWGPPTFEIDGIKMLVSAERSPYEDAQRKVDLIVPNAKTILDTCAGLGYFAACCLERNASRVLSFEKNPDVLWLRAMNPWSPSPTASLQVTVGDVSVEIASLASESMDAVLHDPPRFAIAGQLYSQHFYAHLARVLKPGGLLFHYTGAPNRLSRGRDLPAEVTHRLRRAGFSVERKFDGLFGRKSRRRERTPPG